MALNIERKLPVQQIRDGLAEAGLTYLVPLSKREIYADNDTVTIHVSPRNGKYYPGFVDQNNIVLADVETPSEDILTRDQLHGDSAFIEAAKAAQIQWIEVAHTLLSADQGQEFFMAILSQEDRVKLELPNFISSQRPLRDSLDKFGYLSDGVLVRIDELLSEDGHLLACDPNIIPLGYASIHGFIDQAKKVGFDEFGDIDGYPINLGRLVSENGGRLSGIVTALTYPNWPSHLYTAKLVRLLTGQPFFTIPVEAVNLADGTINSNLVADFYNDLGFEGADAIKRDGDTIASVLVRYCREAPNFHDETQVINPAGFRILESQLWGGLITLPGFANAYTEITGQSIDLPLHQGVNIPTLIARMRGESIEIATSVNRQLSLDWVSINDLANLLTETQESIATSDKPSEYTWFVKTPSTSGKKGVRFTNGARPDKTERDVLKVATRMDLKGIFLLQPKVRSTLLLNEEEQRLKVDLYLSGQDLEFSGIDAMMTPIHQRSSHGGSATRYGLVKL